MVSREQPCYKCEERHPVCHDSCQVYQHWVQKQRDIKTALKAADADYVSINYTLKNKSLIAHKQKKGRHHYGSS